MLSYSFTFQLLSTGNPGSSYLTFTVDKTHHGPVTTPFTVQILVCLLQFFSYAGGFLFFIVSVIDDMLWLCSKLYTQGAFVIILFICSNLLNCLRSVCTIAMTTENSQNSLKVISTKKIVTESSHFDVFLYVRPPHVLLLWYYNALTLEAKHFLQIQRTAMGASLAPTYTAFTISYAKIKFS